MTFICSFSEGNFAVKSPTGKTQVFFDDSERFGPSKLNLRTGDLSQISDALGWFWEWYPTWRDAGRPITETRSSPIGDIRIAAGPSLEAADEH